MTNNSTLNLANVWRNRSHKKVSQILYLGVGACKFRNEGAESFSLVCFYFLLRYKAWNIVRGHSWLKLMLLLLLQNLLFLLLLLQLLLLLLLLLLKSLLIFFFLLFFELLNLIFHLFPSINFIFLFLLFHLLLLPQFLILFLLKLHFFLLPLHLL